MPVEKGRTRNLTRSSGAHDRAAAWSPDGAQVAFLSDASGEDEIWLVAQDGSEPARQLTNGHSGRLLDILWSPDGSHIALTDYLGRLSVVSVEDGAETEVADDPWGTIGDAAWSPNGGHLAFSLNNEAGHFAHPYLERSRRASSSMVTSDLFDSYSPVVGSTRATISVLHFGTLTTYRRSPTWSGTTPAISAMRIYALALRKDVKPLFPPESDEVAIARGRGRPTTANGTRMTK